MPKLLWTKNRSNFGPAPRAAAAMCFDSARNRTVLFGGVVAGGTNINFVDTWEWDGTFWTQVEITGPSARRESAMVYDSTRKVSVLFGGVDSGFAGDTWQCGDGTAWTELSESGPSPRARMAMAFDSTRNRVVLFGGQSGDSFHLNDTWEFDGDDWTQVQDAGPPARCAHSMAFDSVGNRVVLFGGLGTDSTVLSDTWAWDGKNWVQIAEFGPSPRLGAAMAATSGSNLLLFGGVDNENADVPSTVLADTWEFDGKRWTQRQDIGPGPLERAAMAFDSTRSSVVLFGGHPPQKPGDPDTVSGLTWESPVVPVVAAPPVIVIPPPGGPLRVVDISVPANPRLFFPVDITFTLSGPSMAGGTLVHVVPATLADTEGVDLTSFRIPEGPTSFTLTAKFIAAGPTTLSAGIQQVEEASVSVNVSK